MNQSDEETRWRQIASLANVDSVRKENSHDCGQHPGRHESHPGSGNAYRRTREDRRYDISGVIGLQQGGRLVPVAESRFLL